MKFSIIASTFVALTGFASASPGGHGGSVTVRFIGAADASFTQSFPTDGSSVKITNPLSISKIAGGGATCTFHGIDGSVTTVHGTDTVDVGPPQTQISGTCW